MNANEPAFPVDKTKYPYLGLTKREYFSAMALQGYLACPGGSGNAQDAAMTAVVYADALLAELERTERKDYP